MDTFPTVPKLDAGEAHSVSPLTTTSDGLLPKFSQPPFPLHPQHHCLNLLPDLRVGAKGSESGVNLGRRSAPCLLV